MNTEPAAIMMVTYNRLELTKEAVACVLENTQYPFYLCIVDNGSEDGTKEWLQDKLRNIVRSGPSRSCKGILLKLNDDNRGIAIGRNQGLVLADDTDATWLATMDNDVWVPKGWLTESIEIMKANRGYASIGVNMENVGYPVVTLNDKTFQTKPQGNLGTACMVFNKSLHKMLGYFNHKDYGKYGEEDADWGMRTRVVGFKLGYIVENGRHLGEGERDVGEYREFKTASHKRNLAKFNQNCRDYANKRKSLHISFSDE
jgi:GT2 family glycosyltransferase